MNWLARRDPSAEFILSQAEGPQDDIRRTIFHRDESHCAELETTRYAGWVESLGRSAFLRAPAGPGADLQPADHQRAGDFRFCFEPGNSRLLVFRLQSDRHAARLVAPVG